MWSTRPTRGPLGLVPLALRKERTPSRFVRPIWREMSSECCRAQLHAGHDAAAAQSDVLIAVAVCRRRAGHHRVAERHGCFGHCVAIGGNG